MSEQPFGALQDLRVLDLTVMMAGPFGTQILADHGAEVIKIESPAGDVTRAGGPFRPDDKQRTHGGYFQSLNRNKKSLCLDLKSPEGAEVFRRLVRDADVVAENFRTGVMDRLGLSYEQLRQINPRLVYACVRGFGDPRTGASPYVEWPAFDVVAQAMGGIVAITGPDARTPTKIGPGIGDLVPGMNMAFGILAAVHRVRLTGVGQLVDVAMVDSVLALCERTVYQWSVEGAVPGPEGNNHPLLSPFGFFPAIDGLVALAAPQDELFKLLCKLLECPQLSVDPRFADAKSRRQHRNELTEELSARTSKLTKAQLAECLGGRVPFGPVMNIGDIVGDSHFRAREMLVEVQQPGSESPLTIAGVPVRMTVTPGRVRARGPYLGEHTRLILEQAGWAAVEIDGLATRGIIKIKESDA